MESTPSVEAQLAVMNTKLDLLLAGKDDHEARIRSLEQFKWRSVGVGVTFGGSAGAVAAALLQRIS